MILRHVVLSGVEFIDSDASDNTIGCIECEAKYECGYYAGNPSLKCGRGKILKKTGNLVPRKPHA